MSQTVMNDPFAASLAELAGVDLSDVQAIRFENLPAIKAGFKIAGVDMKGNNTESGPRLFIELKCQVVEVLASSDPANESPEAKAKLVGKTHTEAFVVDPAEPLKALGRLKAFLEDAGYTGDYKLASLKAGVANGHIFPGQIRLSKSKKDPSREYANLNPVKEKATGALKL